MDHHRDGPDRRPMLPAVGTPGADLPVRSVLPEFLAALRSAGTAVLLSPPGSGKTSLLPLALADLLPGRILVAEPRRIATRAAARRMSALLGEPVGGRVGYSMRGDRRVSVDTRVEVVTTGLLVRRLQRDPDLPTVAAVVVDEVHERHLDTDLALAFLLDIRANLRPDLQVVATSATADVARLAIALGSGPRPAPVIEATAEVHRVEITWAAPPRPLPLLADSKVDPRLLDHVAATVRRALAEEVGDILVFLPGEAEIRLLTSRLGVIADLEIVQLYGRQSQAQQDRTLQAGAVRRVILSTAVAESSLTVPGVRIVVDAGLSREPRVDHARGLGALVTTKVSRASAAQRAGRAGRQGPGRVYRCWSEFDHTHLQAHQDPEIATSDLTGFALALADWGHPDGTGLQLLDRPPVVALRAAVDTLTLLGAVDAGGVITAKGRAMAAVPASPRLARALLDGGARVGAARAAEVVAILSAESSPGPGDDLSARWRDLRSNSDRAASARWREEVRRLDQASRLAPTRQHSDDLVAGTVVGLAFPERLARVRPSVDDTAGTGYLMAGGTGAQLGPVTALRGAPWLAIAIADRPAGRADARVRLACPVDEATAREIGAPMVRWIDEIRWRENDLDLRRREFLGAVVLGERPLTRPDPSAVAAVVRDGLRSVGLAALPWTVGGVLLRRRMSFCHRTYGDPWPDVADTALLEHLEQWLGSELAGIRRRGDLARIDTASALRRLLPWPDAAGFDQLAPERIQVPTGSWMKLDYTGDGPPVLAVRVQELFGLLDTPQVDGRPVLLHLLSPAGRPAAITADLASFWIQGYPGVRADLRSRYPRHSWPEDPRTAPPVGRPIPRRH